MKDRVARNAIPPSVARRDAVSTLAPDRKPAVPKSAVPTRANFPPQQMTTTGAVTMKASKPPVELSFILSSGIAVVRNKLGFVARSR